MRTMPLIFAVALLLTAVIAGCTETDVVELDVSSNMTMDDKVTPSPRNLTPEEDPMQELSSDVIEGMCSEKVLMALRSCKWSKSANNTLDITIKNNGYKNVTMAFYLYWNGDLLGNVFNSTLFPEKQEWIYSLDLGRLEDKFGEIEKVHATPILTEEGVPISCSNKKLPVLVEGCG